MTFHVRETVWDHGKPISNTLLATIFEGRLEAVDHIRLLQTSYERSGFDQRQDEWWARHDGKSGIHRWTIEEDDEA